jgi:sulfur-oxidizing protein SoxX
MKHLASFFFVAAPLILGDAMPTPLTAMPGDAARGFAIAANRQLGACTLCHAGPFPAEPIPADIGPDLRGVGARLSAGQLRLHLVDPARFNPDSVMPSYRRAEGFVNVRTPGPLLTDQQIEDVVAYLATLTAP